MVQGRPYFDFTIDELSDDATLLTVYGEVDLVSMPRFQVALERALATERVDLIVDAAPTHFLSMQALVALGDVSARVRALTVVTCSDLARRVLTMLGYVGIEYAEVAPAEGGGGWPNAASQPLGFT